MSWRWNAHLGARRQHRPPPPMADALYNSWFDLADVDRDGVLSGQEAVQFFLRSDLPQQTLKRVRLFPRRS